MRLLCASRPCFKMRAEWLSRVLFGWRLWEWATSSQLDIGHPLPTPQSSIANSGSLPARAHLISQRAFFDMAIAVIGILRLLAFP